MIERISFGAIHNMQNTNRLSVNNVQILSLVNSFVASLQQAVTAPSSVISNLQLW